MSSSFNQTDIKIIESYSPEDWGKYLNTFAVEKHLHAVNKIFKIIGLESLPNYLHLESKNLLSSYDDPTQSKHSLYTTALKNYFSEVKKISMGDWVKLYEAIWIQFNAKKFDKLMIQAFMHLYSRDETNEAALKMYEILKRNDVYYGTVFNKKGSSYAIKSIEEILNVSKLSGKIPSSEGSVNIDSSSNTVVFNNETQYFNTTINNTTNQYNTTNNYNTTNSTINPIQLEDNKTPNEPPFYYLIDGLKLNNKPISATRKLNRLGKFLVQEKLINEEDLEAFICLFNRNNMRVNFKSKVVWNSHLIALIFLFKSLMVYGVIKDHRTISKKLSIAFLNSNGELLTNDDFHHLVGVYKFRNMNAKEMSKWVEENGNENIKKIYRELCRIYFNDLDLL
ncbi:MAG: hypothetical protein ACO1N0_00645 [Fluviicola sp.]